DDPARRLLEVVRDDRLASGLRRHAAAARRACGAAHGELELVHGVVRAACRYRRAPGRPDAGGPDGGRVQAATRSVRGRPQPAAGGEMRPAARRVLRLSEHHGDPPVVRRGRRASPERRRSGRAVRRGLRRARRGLSALLVRELGGQSTPSARADAPGVRALREVTAARGARAVALSPTSSSTASDAPGLRVSSPSRGRVHIDRGADVAGRAVVPLATSCRPDVLPYPDAEALDRAAVALSGASRPLLLAGIHCRSDDAAQWLRAFAEALPAPLLATARAKGALPDPHPLMLGVLGVAGVEERVLSRADLIVAIGLDALEPVPAPCWSTRPVLAFGPAPMPDGRGPAVHVPGDVGVVIEELAERLRDKPRADWDVAELDRLRREGAARNTGDGLAARVVRLARETTPAGTI